MADPAITLASVESLIRECRKNLAFPAWLETQFENDTQDRRAKLLRITTFKTIIVYNCLLVGDWLLAPDVLGLALALHFLIVTPWMLFIYRLLESRPRRSIRELTAASIPIAMSLQVVCVYFFTNSAYSSQYLYFLLLTSIYANTSQRLSYFYAFPVSLCICALLPLAIALAHHMATPVAAVQCMILFSCAYMTLDSNFDRERDFRRSYLHALRDRLRVEEKDAEANRDSLTDLANRRFLDAHGAEIWKSGDAARSPVAAIMLDIDHFKAFNDLYGHPAGDACLKRVGACATAELRNSDDLAVRYGGEEFLVLLPNTDIADAVWVAERIRRAIAALGIPNEGAGRSGVVTASFGVTSAPISAISLAELISAADVALYAAKRNGRNQTWPPLLRDHSVPTAEPASLEQARSQSNVQRSA
jgi:diguanylate cyclase (GGDEF)-like protein